MATNFINFPFPPGNTSTTSSTTSEPTSSTTQAPTTQAPTTQSPTTQAPTTQAPTTQAPTTQAPTTQAPTTQAPTTQAPTTQAPTTQAPTTQAPTTQAPTTQAPTTQSPTTTPAFANFDPICLTDKIFWLDASDSDSLTLSGSEVILANDKSGNDYDVTPPSSSNNPAVSSATQNGLQLIEFDGNDYLEVDNVAIPSSGNVQAFIVCEVTSVNNNHDSILSMDASSNDWQLEAGNSTQWRGKINVSNLDGNTTADTGTTSSQITGMHIWNASFDFDSGEFLLRLDGEQLTGSSVVNYTSEIASSQTLRILTNRNENQYPEGKVAEVLIYSNPNEGIRQDVEGYLAHKWGLTSLLDSSHPHKTFEEAGCYHQDPCTDSPLCHSYVDSNGNTIQVRFDISDPDQWDHRQIGGVSYSQPMYGATVTSGSAIVNLSIEFQESGVAGEEYKWTLSRSNADDLIWYTSPGACPSASPVICDCNETCTSTTSTTQAPTTTPSYFNTTEAPTTQAPTTQAPTTQAPTTHQISIDSFSSDDNGLWQFSGSSAIGSSTNNPHIDIASGDSIEFTNDTSQDFYVFPNGSSTPHGTASAGSTETMTFNGTSNFGYSDENDGDPYIQAFIRPS